MVELVAGVADGCRENGCALLGGETAEMPGFYQPGDYELVGFIVGLVDRPKVLDGSRVEAGDVLVGLPRRACTPTATRWRARSSSSRPASASPTRRPGTRKGRSESRCSSRTAPISRRSGRSSASAALHGMAHITGGGITDNLPRVLPPGPTR